MLQPERSGDRRPKGARRVTEANQTRMAGGVWGAGSNPVPTRLGGFVSLVW